ncbi:MAG: M20/M25/M40 family metallo-hydrolase [Cyclobacteriaceae bacterium]
MKSIITSILIVSCLQIGLAQDHDKQIKSIYDEVLINGEVYDNLRVLCKDIGNRLSGSPGAAAAVEFTRQVMVDYGFDTVFIQPVMVPNWKRGDIEIVRVLSSAEGTFELNSLSLGNSKGTGPEGVRAKVIEVKSMDDIETLGKKLEGKIVFLNGPANATYVQTFRGYGSAVIQRAFGASEAGKYGAKAVIVRSITQTLDDVPHTGSLRYKPNMPQIPAMAISTIGADRLSKLIAQDSELEIYMENHSEMKGEVLSHNVIGQINGTDSPDEYIAVGGHLDSWDVGEGAHDDGSGCMQGIEALRALKAVNYTPKRTIRAVMWMNEENGGAGGREYAKQAELLKENHIAAIESDRGGFTPRGFTSSGTDEQTGTMQSWQKYFEPYDLFDFKKPGGGVDIGPLAPQGTLLIGLLPDSQRYFRFHHTAADTFEQVDKRELELGAAAMASMIYLLDQHGMVK